MYMAQCIKQKHFGDASPNIEFNRHLNNGDD